MKRYFYNNMSPFFVYCLEGRRVIQSARRHNPSPNPLTLFGKPWAKDQVCQSLFAYSKLNLIYNILSRVVSWYQKWIDLMKWTVIQSCLKTIWNSCASFYLHIIQKRKFPLSLTSFLYFSVEIVKLLNKCVFVYIHYLKSILNDDSFKEYINPVVFINLKYML